MLTRIHLDGDTPSVVDVLTTEGDYVSSRAVDGTARIVIRSNPQTRFPFVYPSSQAGEQRAEDANREALRNSTLEDWLPGYARLDANGNTTDEGLLVPCDQVHAPGTFAGFRRARRAHRPRRRGDRPGRQHRRAGPRRHRSRLTRLGLRGDHRLGRRGPRREPTRVPAHRRVDLDPPLRTTDNSGLRGQRRRRRHGPRPVLPERARRQPARRHDDRRRPGEHRVGPPRALAVRRRAHRDRSVGDMGNGEQVQSVRFQGDVAYVVTFRQIDPLYTVDLSDPTNPVVRGELKIPGFSSYLHPIGDGRRRSGQRGRRPDRAGDRTKVSLFDVNDLANPRELATWTSPDAWNDVGWDPHGFLWWALEHLAVLPMQTWTGESPVGGVVVLRIENGAITEVGRIDHADPNSPPVDQCVYPVDDLAVPEPATPDVAEAPAVEDVPPQTTVVSDPSGTSSGVAIGPDCGFVDQIPAIVRSMVVSGELSCGR
ncbi:MAG: beta-propeller domain-containing protein [Acidimicrobiales bacterium]